MTERPLISIVTPCFNEEANIDELYARITKATVPLEQKYKFEFIVIDNHSADSTPDKLRALAKNDRRVKVIINTRNFGHIRSPYYGILQSRGLATIYMASDLQDPPELIPEFINYWEKGYKLVMAVKPVSQSSPVVHTLRKVYYRFLDRISDINILKDSTGFGLYDHAVLEHVRKVNDPYPFLRGLISELGYEVKTIPFNQPRRLRGISKNNMYTLYDIAMLGIVSHSKVPIRVATLLGFAIGIISLLTGTVFLIAKFIYWNSIPLGIAPIAIGMFFLIGLQFIFLGVLGEYIGSIHGYAQRRPVVVEQERINFEHD